MIDEKDAAEVKLQVALARIADLETGLRNSEAEASKLRRDCDALKKDSDQARTAQAQGERKLAAVEGELRGYKEAVRDMNLVPAAQNRK